MVKTQEMRPFEDLIKEIEIDGETFTPIEVIAKLTVPHVKGEIIQSSIDKAKFNIGFHFRIDGYQMDFVSVNSNFDIYRYDISSNERLRIQNQVQIVKNLIKWGFIEP